MLFCYSNESRPEVSAKALSVGKLNQIRFASEKAFASDLII